MRRALILALFAVALGLSPIGVPEAQAGKGRSGQLKARAPKKGAKRASERKMAPAIQLKKAADEAPPEGAPQQAQAPTRGPTRIDFDDRLIQGQTNKSGAVYLYDRKELKTRSMIKVRESFREEIVGSVYDS
jgi:hypothetical protein